MLEKLITRPRDKTPHQRYVEQFMHLAEQQVPTSPCLPDFEVRLLRAKLILEEAIETIAGLGFTLERDYQAGGEAVVGLRDQAANTVVWGKLVPTVQPNLIEIVDGCCDLNVVSTGTLSACGVCDLLPQLEVDSSNLRKFGPGSYRRSDGKWVKPPDFVAPDIARVIKLQQR